MTAENTEQSFPRPPQFEPFLQQLRKKIYKEESRSLFEENKYLISLLGAIGVGTAAGLSVSAGVYNGDPSALFNKTNEFLDLPEWVSISMLVIALVALCVIAYNADKSRMENIVIQQDKDLGKAYDDIFNGFAANGTKKYPSKIIFDGILESIALNKEPATIRKQIFYWLKALGINESQAKIQANSEQWWIGKTKSKESQQTYKVESRRHSHSKVKKVRFNELQGPSTEAAPRQDSGTENSSSTRDEAKSAQNNSRGISMSQQELSETHSHNTSSLPVSSSQALYVEPSDKASDQVMSEDSPRSQETRSKTRDEDERKSDKRTHDVIQKGGCSSSLYSLPQRTDSMQEGQSITPRSTTPLPVDNFSSITKEVAVLS